MRRSFVCVCVCVCVSVSEFGNYPHFFPAAVKWKMMFFFFRCDRFCSDEKYILFVRKVWFSPLILTTVKQNFWFRSYLGNSWKGLQRKSFIFVKKDDWIYSSGQNVYLYNNTTFFFYFFPAGLLGPLPKSKFFFTVVI